MSGEKVLLGLSGGVDSAVAARLLLEQGYQVYGHWLDMGLGGRDEAQMVAQSLGIPFSVGDMRADLEEKVCRPFAAEYLAGRTPLPCAHCNRTVKFPALFAGAAAVGAQFVATGHYARIVKDASGQGDLYRGKPQNDQAYMLARLEKRLLPQILFPLGDYEKNQVRELAHGFGIPVADKPDSMEICFIPDGDYAAWIERRGGEIPPPGNFVDKNGGVLGRHKGIHHYTMGQRRGLGISASGRLFVSRIDPVKNEVVLSDGEDLYLQKASCNQINALGPLYSGLRCTVRLRHSKNEYAAEIQETEDGLDFVMETGARAPTPGQLAVFYEGDKVLGSGWIL